jgi:molybdopterin converting factor small subunit
MAVVVHLPGPLAPFAGGQSRLSLPGTRTVGEALRALPPGVRDRVLDEQGRVRPHVNVFVGTESIRDTGGLETPLGSGAELHIIAAVSGG